MLLYLIDIKLLWLSSAQWAWVLSWLYMLSPLQHSFYPLIPGQILFILQAFLWTLSLLGTFLWTPREAYIFQVWVQMRPWDLGLTSHSALIRFSVLFANMLFPQNILWFLMARTMSVQTSVTAGLCLLQSILPSVARLVSLKPTFIIHSFFL